VTNQPNKIATVASLLQQQLAVPVEQRVARVLHCSSNLWCEPHSESATPLPSGAERHASRRSIIIRLVVDDCGLRGFGGSGSCWPES